MQDLRVSKTQSEFAVWVAGLMAYQQMQEGAMGGRQPDGQERLLVEATEFLAGVRSGRIPKSRFAEAMSTSDFPSLLGAVMQRQMKGFYATYPSDWKLIAKETKVTDFRPVQRGYMNFPTGLMERVPERVTPRQTNDFSEDTYEYAVGKYESIIDISFEAIINDDTGEFEQLPEALAKAANNTENYFATTLFVDASGPSAALYNAANGNTVTQANGASVSDPALSIAGLQDAFKVLGAQVDNSGMPIMTTAATLVVPPALRTVANNIVNATQLEITTAGGTETQKVITNNWMRSALDVVVNPWIPLIASTHGNTSWYLFANPDVGRPALEMAFIPSFRNPLILRKRSDVEPVAGGNLPAMGSFDTMAFQWKVMHIFGGAAIDGRATVASKGNG